MAHNNAIDYFSLNNPLSKLRSRVSMNARNRMFNLFLELMKPSAKETVLDVGATPDTSLVESNYFEKLYPYKNKITATSIEDVSNLKKLYPQIRFITTSAYSLPFKDRQFEILFCSAVLEHTGSHKQQKRFIDECLRVCKRYFITTPNKGFPIEMHTMIPLLHWLPNKYMKPALKLLGKGIYADKSHLNLLNTSQALNLFPSSCKPHLVTLKTFGFPSNIIMYGNK